MVKYRWFAVFLMLIAYFMIAGDVAFGQIILRSNAKFVSLYSFPYLQNWKVEGEESSETVSQFGVPVYLFLRPIDNLSFWFVDSLSSASLDAENSDEIKLSGVGDFKIKGSYSMFDNKFLATVGVNLPTGKEALDDDEVKLANILYNEVLGFRVNKLGAGLDVNAGVAFAADLGTVGVSLSPNYLMRGGYNNQKDVDQEYKPGDEFWVVAAFDTVGESAALKGDFSYTHFMPDRIDGEDKLRQGDEIKGRIQVIYQAMPVALMLSFADTIRIKNQILDENSKLIAEQENSHGNKIDADVIGQYFIIRALSISSMAGVTFVGENGYGENGAFVGNIGAGIQVSPRRDASINISAKMLKGNMESGDLDISGFEVGAIFIAKF